MSVFSPLLNTRFFSMFFENDSSADTVPRDN